MHEAADYETRHGAASQMQGSAFVCAEMLDHRPLGEEVRGELDGASEAGPDHGGAHAPVQPPGDALGLVDLPHAVEGVAVLVLRADGEQRREALEARLDEEEGAARGRADDAGAGAAEHVDAQALLAAVLVDQGGQAVPHGLVEAQAAAVEQDLVDVGAAETPVDAAQSLVLYDDLDAVEGALVMPNLVAFRLELTLELHSVH